MNHIPSRPPFYLEAWIWAKHYNSESPILNFWRSFQGNSRKLKHQHFGEIPSPPVGLDRYDLSRGFIPSPSDQSDHPRKPSPLVISTRQASSRSRKIPWGFWWFFSVFPAGTLRSLFGLFFPPVPTSVTRSSSATWTFFHQVEEASEAKLHKNNPIGEPINICSGTFLGGKLCRILHSFFLGGFSSMLQKFSTEN